MFMIQWLPDIFAGKVEPSILAEYLIDKCSGLPEASRYINRLLDKNTLYCQTVIDAICKFGSVQERKLINKSFRFYWRRLRMKRNDINIRRAKMRKLKFTDNSLREYVDIIRYLKRMIDQ
jgi:hypothetical protein